MCFFNEKRCFNILRNTHFYLSPCVFQTHSTSEKNNVFKVYSIWIKTTIKQVGTAIEDINPKVTHTTLCSCDSLYQQGQKLCSQWSAWKIQVADSRTLSTIPGNDCALLIFDVCLQHRSQRKPLCRICSKMCVLLHMPDAVIHRENLHKRHRLGYCCSKLHQHSLK